MLQSIYLPNYNSTLKQTTEDSGNLYVTGELALTSVVWSFLIRATLSVACDSAAVTPFQLADHTTSRTKHQSKLTHSSIHATD